MKKGYHLYLNTSVEKERSAWQVLAKAPNKKDLICRALICYAQDHPTLVHGAAAKAVAQSAIPVSPEQAALIVEAQVSEAAAPIMDKLNAIQTLLDQLSKSGIVVTASQAEPETGPEQDTAIVKRIERAVAPTDDELRLNSQQLDPLARDIMAGFG